jgi:phytoene dehydrogenase-like protein
VAPPPAAAPAAASDAGAEIRRGAEVARILVHEGRLTGVALADGSTIEAPLVVSNADPRRTLLGLLGREHLEEEVARSLDALELRSGSAKLNLVLDRLPAFRGSAPGAGPEHRGTIHVGATDLAGLDAAFRDASEGRLPARPMVELTLPSALDPSLAPSGRYVASMFVQYVPPALSASDWAPLRSELAARCFAVADEVAPGFRESVVHCEVLTPPDLESLFGLSGGNIFHGAMTLDRLLFLRGVAGAAPYRTPVDGLYLCGAGTHPGGGVMGACGRNAAREILRDLAR